MKKLYTTTARDKGFTVLFAVIVSSLVLAIGISIANITLKQIRISSLGRESLIAFYAADSISECVMYHDIINEAFGENQNDAIRESEITCFGAQIAVAFDVDGGADNFRATTTIPVNVTNGDTNMCGLAEIGKYDTDNDGYTDRTIILSRGYNTCNENSDRLLERGIKIHY